MKKILLLSILLLVAFGCQQQTKDTPLLFDLTILSQSASTILVGGTAAQVVVGAASFNSTMQEYAASFNPANVIVNWEFTPARPDERSRGNITKGLKLSISALTVGSHYVTVNVWDGNQKSSVTVLVSAQEKVYDLQLIGEPKDRPCGKRVGYEFRLIDPETPNAINANYTVWAKVVKGKGVVQMMSNEVLWNDTIPNYEPQSCIVPNESWGGLYTGFEVGENQVEFTIIDKNNTKTVLTRSFIIDSSAFELYDITGVKNQLLPDTIEQHAVAKGYSTRVRVFGNYENKYSLSCEWNSPYAGTMHAKPMIGYELETLTPGQWCTFSNAGGNDPFFDFSFEPNGGIGVTHNVTLLVKDMWGTIKRHPFSFHIKGSNYNVATDLPSTFIQFQTRTFETSITNFANDDQARFKYRFLPVAGYDDLGMTFYSEIGTDGKPIYQSLGSSYYVGWHLPQGSNAERAARITTTITFSTPGTKVFDLEITDRFGVVRLYRQQTQITENRLHFTTNKPSYDVVVGNSVPINTECGVTYQGAVYDITMRYNLLSGQGVFKASGVEMASGSNRIYKRFNDVASMGYTPSVGGRHELELTVTLPDGRTQTVRPVVNATYPAAYFRVIGSSEDLNMGQALPLGLVLNQQGHNENLTWRYRFLNGSGTLTQNSAPLVENMDYSQAQTTQASPLALSFVSDSYVGNVAIEFMATDKNDVTTKLTYSFKVVSTHPTITVSDTPEKVALDKTATLSVALAKPYYSGEFTFEWSVANTIATTGRGSFNVASGSKLSGGTHDLVFTPSAPGKVNLTFKITDDFGSTATKVVTFEVINTPINLSILGVPISVAFDKTFSLNTAMNKAGYSGKFTVEYSFATGSSTTGRGSFNVASGSKLSGGAHDLVFTPSAPGKVDMTLTITDDFGYNATKKLDFEILPPPIIFTPSVEYHTPAEPNGGESSFTFTVTEQNHPEDFAIYLNFDFLSSRQQYFIDGVEVVSNELVNISSGTHTITERNNYDAKYTHLAIRIFDKYGQEKAIAMPVKKN